MRPLYHPTLDEITVQSILYALSDPVRVQIVLALAGCTKNCSAFLNLGAIPLPKSTLSQHMKILREAGLIRSHRQGVELINTTRCAELTPKFGPMIYAILDSYKSEWQKLTPSPGAPASRQDKTKSRRQANGQSSTTPH